MIPASAARWRYQSLWQADQRCHEQLFRVPAGAVTPKGRIGGAVNDGFAFRADLVIAGIVAISRSAAA